jgi:hypothetical protein
VFLSLAKSIGHELDHADLTRLRAGSELALRRLSRAIQQRSDIFHNNDASGFRQSSHQTQLVVVDDLSVVASPWDNNRHFAMMQRVKDGADSTVANDEFRLFYQSFELRHLDELKSVTDSALERSMSILNDYRLREALRIEDNGIQETGEWLAAISHQDQCTQKSGPP